MRLFTLTQLDEMCKSRPEGYREAMLALAEPVQGQPDTFQFDPESAEFASLRSKFTPGPPPPSKPVPKGDPGVYAVPPAKFTHSQPAPVKPVRQVGMSVLTAEHVLHRGKELAVVLGEKSHFTYAYGEWTAKEKAGGCKSCSRGRELAKLVAALKTALIPATPETKQQVRRLFLDTAYFESEPYPVRWDAIISMGG